MPAMWTAALLSRELEAFERELELFPDEASIRRTVPGVTNSAGTLALHVSGNLLYFVGAVLGSSGYVRDRPREFSARDIPRAVLVGDIRKAREAVMQIVGPMTDNDSLKPYPEEVGGVRMATGLFLSHLSAHLAFHLGQAGYLRRVVTGDSRSSAALPMVSLASIGSD